MRKACDRANNDSSSPQQYGQSVDNCLAISEQAQSTSLLGWQHLDGMSTLVESLSQRLKNTGKFS